MAESIIQKDKTHCFLCGKNSNGDYFGLDEHHCFGSANRKLSERFGLKVYLCHNSCHLYGVHQNAEINNKIKAIAQKRAMQYYGWTTEQFIEIFGKSYI